MATLPKHQTHELIHLLSRAERLLSRRLTEIVDTQGLSLDGWRVVSLLSDGAGHHMTEIAEHAFLPPATLTKLMDQLVEDNLVYRRVDEIDRRRIRAHLTPRGRRLHERAAQRIEAALPELGDASLQELLTRLVGSLDEPVV